MFEKLISGVYTKGKYIKMITFVEVSIFAMGFNILSEYCCLNRVSINIALKSAVKITP